MASLVLAGPVACPEMMACWPIFRLPAVQDISAVLAAQNQLVALVCSEDRDAFVVTTGAIAE